MAARKTKLLKYDEKPGPYLTARLIAAALGGDDDDRAREVFSNMMQTGETLRGYT